MELGVIMSKKVETTFYLTDELVTALKIKAVKEKRKYSDVADELLRQGLELPKVEPAVKGCQALKTSMIALPVIVWAVVSLALITAMLMLAPLRFFYHVVNAQSFSKKSSTNCEGNVCHTTVCINNNCQTSVSNPTQLLNSMPQLKSHGLLSNSIQQLLNSTNP
jgi:uncharacterized protein YyaL (SSP411 family)